MQTGAGRMPTGGGGRDSTERREAAFHGGLLDKPRSARAEPPVRSAGGRRRIGGKLLDDIDHLGPLRGREPDERPQEAQALNRFAGRISKLCAYFGNGYAIFHLAPF